MNNNHVNGTVFFMMQGRTRGKIDNCVHDTVTYKLFFIDMKSFATHFELHTIFEKCFR